MPLSCRPAPSGSRAPPDTRIRPCGSAAWLTEFSVTSKNPRKTARALDATPAFLHDLEALQGQRALSAFLESYAVLVPFLQQTAKQLLRRWLEVSGAAGRPVAATRRRSPREHNLLGRSTEQERIERLLDRARAGASDAMIIRGVAGLGKSTLLASAGEHAKG